VTQGLTSPTARDAWQDWEAERLIQSLRRVYQQRKRKYPRVKTREEIDAKDEVGSRTTGDPNAIL